MVERWKAGFPMNTELHQPAYRFKRPAPGEVLPAVEVLSREGEEPSRERRLLCKICGHYITSRDRVIEQAGSHVHVFTNPAGVTFRIGCFSSAPGCLNAGEPTEDYTWFPGFAWSFAVCAGCMNHLGWLYESGTSGFYGLILENLAEDFLQ
jgi:hypothetical protein